MKSPIELQGDANLTLVVDGTFTVTGGAAGNGEQAAGSAASHAGGSGGKAAIHVPTGAVLTIKGNGTIAAYGGFAGDGGDGTGCTNQCGPGGGGGAGAGIGGNGGDGGTGTPEAINPPAPAGENAGTINFYGTGKVTAIGGGGGYGGKGSDNGYTGGGGGGYPAAGVGGGGAGGGGGNHGIGAGGFSGGSPENWSGTVTVRAQDGDGNFGGGCGGGGGYFSQTYQTDKINATYQITNGGHWGQLGGTSHRIGDFPGNWGISTAGDGGQGGSGGTVNVSVLFQNKLEAYNGTYLTAANDWDKTTATPIYMQLGYKPSALRDAGITAITNKTVAGVHAAAAEKGLTPTNASAILGVGSGAGATEVSNGTGTYHLVPGR